MNPERPREASRVVIDGRASGAFGRVDEAEVERIEWRTALAAASRGKGVWRGKVGNLNPHGVLVKGPVKARVCQEGEWRRSNMGERLEQVAGASRFI